MAQQSDKHGPAHDDSLKHETEGLVRAGRSTRAQEWRDPEPVGEEQPAPDVGHDGPLAVGVPPGMTPADVDKRSTLARYLGQSVYPADRDQLLVRLSEQNAPDRLVRTVAGLPADEKYGNVQEVAVALGYAVESDRF